MPYLERNRQDSQCVPRKYVVRGSDVPLFAGRSYRHRREEGKMDGLLSPALWSSPVGLGIFFIGLGVLLWGVSKLAKGGEKDG